MATTTSDLTSVERALKQSLSSPCVLDVLLFAPSRRRTADDGRNRIEHALPVLAVGSILKETEYFSKLLTSGFAEATADENSGPLPDPARDYAEEYDYASDSDLDEWEEDRKDADSSAEASGSNSAQASVSSFAAPSQKEADIPHWKCHHAVLPTVAVRTLRACIFYLYTGKVRFLPLKSQGVQSRHLAMVRASGDSNAPPPCSPKSMYRLAEAYGLAELQKLSFDAIIARLSADNIAEEAFCRLICRYDELREATIPILWQEYRNEKVAKTLPVVIKRLVAGELSHSDGLLQCLLGLRHSDVASKAAI